MKIRSNIHTHCTLCDGESTPEEVVEAAIALGFTDIGFSSHSTAPYDPGCPGVADNADYRRQVAAIGDRYAGKINVLCGIESDTFAPVDGDDYDYVIGSNHFLPVHEGLYYAVDSTPERLREAMQRYYGNDGIAMARDYYSLQQRGIQGQKPDVVGHFDLLKKNNRSGAFFDENSAAYQKLALEALDNTLDILDGYGGMIEINTGAMTRGSRDEPYPSLFLLKHAAQRGARVIITSDSHHKVTLNAYFEEARQHLQQAGFRWMMVLRGGCFQPVEIE